MRRIAPEFNAGAEFDSNQLFRVAATATESASSPAIRRARESFCAAPRGALRCTAGTNPLDSAKVMVNEFLTPSGD